MAWIGTQIELGTDVWPEVFTTILYVNQRRRKFAPYV